VKGKPSSELSREKSEMQSTRKETDDPKIAGEKFLKAEVATHSVFSTYIRGKTLA